MAATNAGSVAIEPDAESTRRGRPDSGASKRRIAPLISIAAWNSAFGLNYAQPPPLLLQIVNTRRGLGNSAQKTNRQPRLWRPSVYCLWPVHAPKLPKPQGRSGHGASAFLPPRPHPYAMPHIRW